jgi:hypothetical protein
MAGRHQRKGEQVPAIPNRLIVGTPESRSQRNDCGPRDLQSLGGTDAVAGAESSVLATFDHLGDPGVNVHDTEESSLEPYLYPFGPPLIRSPASSRPCRGQCARGGRIRGGFGWPGES